MDEFWISSAIVAPTLDELDIVKFSVSNIESSSMKLRLVMFSRPLTSWFLTFISASSESSLIK